MNILATSAIAITAVFASAWGAGQFVDRNLHTQIIIDAPASEVWDQLADIKSYSSWNPFIKQFSGTLKAGETINVTIQPDGGSAMTFTPLVLKAEQNKELRWIGKLGFKGVFDGEHYFIISQTADGKTLFKHGENFSGMLAPLLLAMIGDDTLKGFKAMNQALKKQVEA